MVWGDMGLHYDMWYVRDNHREAVQNSLICPACGRLPEHRDRTGVGVKVKRFILYNQEWGGGQVWEWGASGWREWSRQARVVIHKTIGKKEKRWGTRFQQKQLESVYLLEPGTSNYNGISKYELAMTAGKPGVFEGELMSWCRPGVSSWEWQAKHRYKQGMWPTQGENTQHHNCDHEN